MSTDRPPLKRRSSYHLSNALRFKSIWDMAVDNWKNEGLTEKDVVIDYDSIEMQPGTLCQRLSEALRWLIDNYDELPPSAKVNHTQADYATIRGMVRVQQRREFAKITFPGSFAKPTGRSIAGAAQPITWKTAIEQFLAAGDQLVYRNERILLTAEDIKWLEDYLKDPDLEVDIKPNLIMIVKKIG